MPCSLLAIIPLTRPCRRLTAGGNLRLTKSFLPPAGFSHPQWILEHHALGQRVVDVKNIRRPNIFPGIQNQPRFAALAVGFQLIDRAKAAVRQMDGADPIESVTGSGWRFSGETAKGSLTDNNVG